MPEARSIAGTLLLLTLILGCVSSGKYKEVVADRDDVASEKQRLDERIELMETQTTTLQNERVQLMEQLEDTTLERDDLAERVARQGQLLGNLRQTLVSREELIGTQKAALDARTDEVKRLRGTYDTLVADLEAEVSSGQIEIQQLREGIRLNVSDDILFPSGSANLNTAGIEVLKKVAREVGKKNYRVAVEGHTDNLAISKALAERFPTNWELASARASRVARLFVENGVAGERIEAVSRSHYAPIADNRTADGRALNRRIEIRLHPAEGTGPLKAKPNPETMNQTGPRKGKPTDAAPAKEPPAGPDPWSGEGAAPKGR